VKDIILIGGFFETVELCEICGFNIIGIIDSAYKNTFAGYKVIGDDSDAPDIYRKHPYIPLIIAPDQPLARKRIVKMYREIGFHFETLISPKAFISPSAKIGEGVLVQSFCNISSNVILGDFVKLNTYANVMHDCIIGDYTTIAPNAVLLGTVKTGERAYIGAGSTLIQNNTIGSGSIVGAGAVVTKDVEDNVTVIGVPAKKYEGNK